MPMPVKNRQVAEFFLLSLLRLAVLLNRLSPIIASQLRSALQGLRQGQRQLAWFLDSRWVSS